MISDNAMTDFVIFWRSRFGTGSFLAEDAELAAAHEDLERLCADGGELRARARAFAGAWTRAARPRFNQFLRWLGASKPARAHHAAAEPHDECAYCGGTGQFPIVIPAFCLYSEADPFELGLTIGQQWPHGRASQMALERWNVPCLCSAGKRWADGGYLAKDVQARLREAFQDFYAQAHAGKWALEPGRKLSPQLACLCYQRRAAQQDWQPTGQGNDRLGIPDDVPDDEIPF